MQFAICWNLHFKSGGLQTGLGARDRVQMRQLVLQQSKRTARGLGLQEVTKQKKGYRGEIIKKKRSGLGDARTSVSERVWGWEVGY